MATLNEKKNVGNLVDSWHTARRELAKLEDAAKCQKVLVGELAEDILSEYAKQGLKSCKGSLGGATAVETEQPTVNDYTVFIDFVKAHDAFELFQRRVSKRAWLDWREQLAEATGDTPAHAQVPGIKPYKRVTLRATKA